MGSWKEIVNLFCKCISTPGCFQATHVVVYRTKGDLIDPPIHWTINLCTRKMLSLPSVPCVTIVTVLTVSNIEEDLQ